MNGYCIVNCAFGEPYDECQPRLQESLAKHWKGPRIIWTDALPAGSPTHSESPFAFKLYAMKYARESGYPGVIWLDGGGYLTGSIEGLINKTINTGYYAVEGWFPLYQWISDDALRHLGETRHGLKEKGWKLMGGTPYALDFRVDIACTFFDRWWKAMEAGCFKHVPGDSNTDFHGHRHDEAVASVLFHQLGMTPSPLGEFYSGDESDLPTVAIRSGGIRK
jgi:hypothetical protein